MSQQMQGPGQGQDFDAADGEGDAVDGVETASGSQDVAEPQEAESSKERTEHLLPDSTTGDEGGSHLESNPN